MPKILLATILAACVGVALVHAPLSGAQAPATAWSTACSASHCTASAKVPAREANLPYAYQLRISRFADARTELVLLTARRTPAPDAAIDVRIDGKPVADLTPGSGYRRIGRSNTFLVADGETAALLRAMREGRQISLAFRATAGGEERVALPLGGLDAALSKIGVNTPAMPAQAPSPGKTATAKTSPAKKPPTSAPPSKQPPATAAARQDAGPRPEAAAPLPRAAPPAPSTAPAASASAATPAPAGELPAAALDAPAADASTPAGAAAAPLSPRRTADSVSVPRQFACQGNEPFWNLTIDGDDARFVSLSGNGDAQPVLLSGRLRATATSTGATFGWRGTGADGSVYGALIERRSCRDSMSDREGVTTFSYAATVAAPGGATLHGCCNASAALDSQAGAQGDPTVQLADLRTRAPEDWTRHLPDMLAAVQVCLDRTPGDGAYVTKAWPMNRGMVGVRTRNASVGWFECVAPQDGRAVEHFAPVAATGERVPDEERVLYVPAGVARHTGNCFRHEEVLDQAGRPLGWLTANACWRAPGAAVVERR